MQTYRKTPPAVHVAKQRLALVADLMTRDEGTSAAAIGRDHGVSRAQVYKLVDRATDALVPRPQGPTPKAGTLPVSVLQARLATSQDTLAAARVRIAELEQQLTRTVEITARRAHALELVLTVENVSQRGIQTIFDVAFDGQQRPSLGALNARLRSAGQSARRLLDTARAQARDHVTCLMGDDIFFAGTPVKVIAEPRSVAILNVGRWPWHAAEDWALWLEEFGALQLFISDLGTDLLGAAADLKLPHQADFFHEMRWWERKVFGPIAGEEQTVREQVRQYEERGIERLTARDRTQFDQARTLAAQLEADFFLAYAAVEEIRALFQPTQPDGTLWTDAAVDRAWDRIEEQLLAIRHPAGKRACRHVTKHGHRFTTHRILLDAIAVDLRPGTAWSAHAVRQAVLQIWTLEAQAMANDTPITESIAAQRRARCLRTALGRACRNLAAVEVALKRHCKYPPRSSSAVEALNSQLRVLQMVHRTVNDTLLSLVALAWNLTPRREGRRKGRSPYAMLRVDLRQGDRPWYEVLLDAQAA